MATVNKDFKVKNNISLANTADTATAASHYIVETSSDGVIRPKTLANVKSEIVTTAAVNAAAATTVGTLTSLTVSGNLTVDTNTLFVDSVNNKVGIGTTSPSGVLDLGSATGGRSISWGTTNGNYANIWTAYSSGSLVLASGLRGSTATDTYVSSYGGSSIGRGAIRINLDGSGIQLFVDSATTTADGTAITPTERAKITTSGLNVTGTISATSTISGSGLAGSLLSSATPLVDGTAAAGTSAIPSRQDHVHPTDTSRAATNQTMYIGTTAVTINRSSASLALTGITSIDGSAATLTTARTIGDVSFNGSANIVPERIVFKDTRSTNYNPFSYQGITLHLKSNTTDALSDGGTYHGVLDLVHWSDSSGGVNHQLGLTDNGNMYIRYSTGASTWSSWAQFATRSNNLSVFSATTSAQLAGVISDETGSGALVFANSPTLSGTPLAPTAAPGTNTTQIATTEFVNTAMVSVDGGVPSSTYEFSVDGGTA